MDTPNKDDQSPSFLWSQVLTPPFRSAPSSSTPPASPSMSTPTLSLWSRKLALQSEELNSLLQKSTTKLHEHQEELSGLLNTCKADITHTQKQLELAAKTRDGEVDVQLATLRRLTQTTTDLLYALEAKLSLLETLHTIHHKLQSHDLLFRDLAQGQKRLLVQQEKMANNQEIQAGMLKDTIDTLARVEKQIQESLGAGKVAREPPLNNLKRPRRLLSDEGLFAEEVRYQPKYREGSTELLSLEEVRMIRGRANTGLPEENENTGAEVCRGGGVFERPPKRKLLSTMDVEQFSDDEL